MCGRCSMRNSGGKAAEGIDCEIPVLPPRYNMTPSEDGIIVRLDDVGEMYASVAEWDSFQVG